ncbi:hypothetical protein QVD17_35824 [Tagetes erecta]|uniref:non-specific serine/threonine protein kinase n=1 Tax=Tagetes erecta TaxID=13708 RepID=A0AAD8JSX1_TARER|nr:hypothetical protein QVD17_35824 [Tagetes erecta]
MLGAKDRCEILEKRGIMLLSLFSKLEAIIVVALAIHMIGVSFACSNVSDHLALLEIKAKITHDPQGVLTSWNDSIPFCQWRGVTCGRRHERVTMLNLTDMGLVARHNLLDLVQRINIIKDVACALEYLHFRCGNVVVHCDLKPSNILLDADMVAHIGDFGLAKILSRKEGSNAHESSSSIIRGTIGYAPPEYGLGNEVSTAGDIYSYGILLLEMLTGKKPVDSMFEKGLSLHSYTRSALVDGSVLQIVDPMLLNKYVNEKSLISLVEIGVQCSYDSPQDRMDIGTVVHKLLATIVAS